MADKISAYHRYCQLHEKLFDLVVPTECAKVAGELLDAYLENRLIFRELEYYRSTGQVLGDHPIFQLRKDMDEFRALSGKEKIKKRNAVYAAVRRAAKQLEENDKEHLVGKRRDRLQYNERLLGAIEDHLDRM